MFNSDLAAASLVLGISAVAWTRAIHFSPMGGIFVRFVLGILTLLGLILLLKSRWSPEKVRVKGAGDYGLVLFMGVAMACYLALIPYLGFLLASILFFSFTSWLLDRQVHAKQRFLRSCGAGIGLTLLFFFAFKYALSVPLPSGVLWG